MLSDKNCDIIFLSLPNKEDEEMALRFCDYCLRDENGKIFLISYWELREACLRNPFKDLSISNIIFETVNRLTGEKVIRNGYSHCGMYVWLEKAIQSDVTYQATKSMILAKRKCISDAGKRQKICNRYTRGYNLQVEKSCKKRGYYY